MTPVFVFLLTATYNVNYTYHASSLDQLRLLVKHLLSAPEAVGRP